MPSSVEKTVSRSLQRKSALSAGGLTSASDLSSGVIVSESAHPLYTSQNVQSSFTMAVSWIKDLTHFIEVFRVEPTVRIGTIKHGVRADVFVQIARSMDRSKEQLGKTLGLSVTTVDRKMKAGEMLSAEQGERVVGIARLIGQVQAMVDESGNPEGFDAARWLGRWLDEPLPALGGDRPSELMDTAEGRSLVSNLLAMAQSGAYA